MPTKRNYDIDVDQYRDLVNEFIAHCAIDITYAVEISRAYHRGVKNRETRARLAAEKKTGGGLGGSDLEVPPPPEVLTDPSNESR